jgi:putative transcriptional regulator
MAAPYQIGHKLKGKCLIATPRLHNSMWQETVIFLTAHESNGGAVGYVINRPSGTSINKLLEEFNHTGQIIDFPDPIYLGGPVKERNISMIHSGDWYSSSTRPVTKHISLSYDDFMIEKMAMYESPNEFLMLAGSSNWAPGQLEKEIEEGSWLVVDANPAIIFSSKKDQLWSLCLEIYSQTMFDEFFG